MKLPSVKDFNFKNKKVLLRLDLDVPLRIDSHGHWQVKDGSRIENSLKTINFLVDQQPEKIIVLAHLGRPDGKTNPNFSLLPVAKYLDKEIGKKIKALGIEFFVRENLRFDKGEEENSLAFAKKISQGMDVFVNESFATAHRKHASVYQLSRLLPTFFGFNFLKEVETLMKIKQEPKRPVVVLLGGAKKDKLELAKKLSSWADFLLIGGKLAKPGDLTADGRDINKKTIDRFALVIKKAGTIIWAGPMGVFEEKGSDEGTRQIGKLVTGSSAFTVIGGGDTQSALSQFNLIDRINYVSTGGGAMLYFLAFGKLPALEGVKGQ